MTRKTQDMNSIKPEDIIAPQPSKTMGVKIRGYFLTGIFVTAPVTITLYIAYKFFSFIDNQVHQILSQPYDGTLYQGITLPGAGVIIAFLFFIFVGWFASNIIGKFLINLGEGILDRIPVIRSLYSAIKQVFETITQSQSEAFREVVMVEYPRKGLWAIGFVTGVSKGEVQNCVNAETINVFLPTTPNPTSGFLLFVPKDEIKFLKMSVEDGIKLVVSGGIIIPPSEKEGYQAVKKKTSSKPSAEKVKPTAAVKKTTTKKAPVITTLTKKKT
jgi:uncharacterized membrane protein